jgi:hypothetical protein
MSLNIPPVSRPWLFLQDFPTLEMLNFIHTYCLRLP